MPEGRPDTVPSPQAEAKPEVREGDGPKPENRQRNAGRSSKPAQQDEAPLTLECKGRARQKEPPLRQASSGDRSPQGKSGAMRGASIPEKNSHRESQTKPAVPKPETVTGSKHVKLANLASSLPETEPDEASKSGPVGVIPEDGGGTHVEASGQLSIFKSTKSSILVKRKKEV